MPFIRLMTSFAIAWVRALFHATAVVTTFNLSRSGLTTTFSGACFFRAMGTSAIPWPHPTNAICDVTELTSCNIRGENPHAWHEAIRLSK